MKNPIIIVAIALSAFLFSAASVHAQTSSAAAGELIYVHIADSTYQVFLKLYQDCSATAAPDSVSLCITNSCSTVVGGTVISTKMGKFSSSTNLNTGCSNVKTSCDSVGSLITGYRETFYSRIVTLPYRCNNWKFASHIGNRNDVYIISNATIEPMYLEATLNNTVSHEINSPYFSIKPQNYARQNEQYTYNGGALDVDGDSIWTTIIKPLTGVISCGDTAVDITYPTVSPPYNLFTNPIQTNNSFSFSSQTGQMTFTPQYTGKGNIAMRTNKYRNGVQIGSIMREMQINTLASIGGNDTITTYYCGLKPPTISTFPSFGPNGCIGSNMIFCFYVKSSNTNAKLYLSDNLLTSIPNATYTYINQGSDSVTAILNWTPTANEIGNHISLTIITDSTCEFPGLIKQQVEYINYQIWGPTKASNDTSICGGSIAYLSASGGQDYQWTVLPGGDSTSLSNPNIPNPVAFPDKTTTYVVTSTLNPYCTNLNKDTVTITVDNPIVNITSNKNNINYGDTVTFTASISNCDSPTYQWMIDGIPIQGETYSSFSTATLFDQQDVTCKLNCTNNCNNSKTRISNTITMNVATSQSSNNFAAGGELLYVHISGTTYQYFFKMYRDCFSAAAPDSIPVCFYNPCNNGGFTVKMGAYTGTLPPGNNPFKCPGYKDACDDPNSTIQGYSTHWYSTIVSLPLRCNSWKTHVNIESRNFTYNLKDATSQSLFAEVTLNNSLSYTNSSPFFSTTPMLYAAKGKPFSLNNGALDADGDSLVTELIAPQSGSVNCNYSPTPIAFNNAKPAFNLINNPFQTGNSFFMNSKTGYTEFNSTTLGKSSFAVRTTEYRNGVEIGSVTRDIQVITLEETSYTENATHVIECTNNNINVINDTLHACIGDTISGGDSISFCFKTVAKSPSARLHLSHSLSTTIPGASIQLFNQDSDSVYATFKWAPTANDTGYHTIHISVVDSVCKPPGILLNQGYNITIGAWGPVTPMNDTSICIGDSIELYAIGGRDYVWTIYGDGYNDSNHRPIILPKSNTTFSVVSRVSAHCSHGYSLANRVSVNNPRKTIIIISTENGTAITKGDTATFLTNVFYCTNVTFQWNKNNTPIPGANSYIYTTSDLNNGDVLSCTITCLDDCVTTKDTTSNKIKMLVFPTGITKVRSKGGIYIYPNPNNGKFTIELDDKSIEEKHELEVTNIFGQVVHTETFTENIKVIDLVDVVSGVYLLKIQTSDKVQTIRFTVK